MYDYTNKQTNINNLINFMLARSVTMFEYDGLPDTIPQKNLELILQKNGKGFFTKHNNEYYVFQGSLGGEENVYGEPTLFNASNLALNLTITYKIGTDGVLIGNDYLNNSLLNIYDKYCSLIIENDISMNLLSVNSRLQNLISANDDRTLASAQQYINQVYNGKLGIIAETQLFDALKTHSMNTNSSVKMHDLIEYHQYLKAGLFNEIGLNSNFNMKKERLISNEIEINSEALYPLVDNMLNCRREALKKINDKYGLNIKVEFNSSWDYRVNNGEPLKNEDVENEPTEREFNTAHNSTDLKNVSEKTIEEGPEK